MYTGLIIIAYYYEINTATSLLQLTLNIQIYWRYSLLLVLVGFVDDLVNPSQEPANSCVHSRKKGVTTTMTP